MTDTGKWIVTTDAHLVKWQDGNVVGTLSEGDCRVIFFTTRENAARLAEALDASTELSWEIMNLDEMEEA